MVEFQPGSRIYVDTNIWIYYVETNSAFTRQIHKLFLQAETAMAVLVTSEITIAECIYKPSLDGNSTAVLAYDTLLSSGEIELVPLDSSILRQAAERGGVLGLKLIDAVHYTSALSQGCSVFITPDQRFRSGPAMTVVTVSADPPV